mmetsp:Transcript_76861/g.215647  ORF Transcript_76861/g.215647 Transcript_76861/m.215647 type:complete len:135 (-) Transcript_76861:1467-1871(-)
MRGRPNNCEPLFRPIVSGRGGAAGCMLSTTGVRGQMAGIVACAGKRGGEVENPPPTQSSAGKEEPGGARETLRRAWPARRAQRENTLLPPLKARHRMRPLPHVPPDADAAGASGLAPDPSTSSLMSLSSAKSRP